MPADRRTAVLETIDQVLRGLEAQRVKRASPLTEPGGYDGESEHPTADADDGTQRVRTGERYSEHSETLRDQQNRLDPESQDDVQEGSQDSAQTDIGLESTSTGETPEEETAGVQSEKDDPGSDHPARTDNDALNGGKYAAAVAEFDRLSKQASEIGNQLLADISVAYSASAKSASIPRAEANPAASQPAGQLAAPQATQADAAAWADWLERQSQASAEYMIALGSSMAEKVAAFYDQFFSSAAARELHEILGQRTKQAENDEEGMSEDSETPAAEESPGGTEEGPMVPDDLGLSDEDAQALLEALLAAEAAPGEPAPAADGPPPVAPDVAAPGTSEEEELAMLAQAMDELGVQPEELAAAAAAKTAAALRALQQGKGGRGGSDRQKAQKYARIRDYVMELTGRKS